jgi:hypothetical protein
MTTHEKIADIIGYHMASLVSGNNQPDMSGDPRARLHAHVRRRFDDACREAAGKIVAYVFALLPEDAAGLVERLRDMGGGDHAVATCHEAASLIQSQAARIASLEAGLRPFARIAEVEDFAGTKDGESIIVNVSLCRTARDLLNKGFSHD